MHWKHRKKHLRRDPGTRRQTKDDMQHRFNCQGATCPHLLWLILWITVYKVPYTHDLKGNFSFAQNQGMYGGHNAPLSLL